MKSISFANPYLLLLAIPLLLILIIPYIISVRKDNRSTGTVASFVIHIAIIILITLAIAGMIVTTVMTKTTVYVVADVSYSAEESLDRVDEHIKEIAKDLPTNTELGVVCFGKEAVLLSGTQDEKIKSVREAEVDTSGTNIVGALEFTSSLFEDGVIKRIVLITDGKDTCHEGSGELISMVNELDSSGIYIDAIYLDDNIKEGTQEMQISDAEFTKSTYLNHESSVNVLIQSSYKKDNVMLELYQASEGGELVQIDRGFLSVEEGFNNISLPLPTNVSGTFDYELRLITDTGADKTEENNTFLFTQSVAGKIKVLLITGTDEDRVALDELYGEDAEIDTYLVKTIESKIPVTLEELSEYDEIVLSNVDVRKINNVNAFLDALEIVVSLYGKSLITMGDLGIQNKDDQTLTKLEEMLPVKFGNTDLDAKLYTIVIDSSRSMFQASKLALAKKASIKLLSLLTDEDYVAVVTFSGEVEVIQTPTQLTNRAEVEALINGIQPTQGTFLGQGLKSAYTLMENLDFKEKQVMLISDGISYTNEDENARIIATQMGEDGIAVSCVNMLNNRDQNATTLLKAIASNSNNGIYYEITSTEERELDKLIFTTIGDKLTEAIIEKESDTHIIKKKDGLVSGFLSLPSVNGYVQSRAKLDATTVVSVDYEKESGMVEVPLYAFRDYGNGRVATFTSSLSGTWLQGWSEEARAQLVDNMFTVNTPKERNNYPFVITLSEGGAETGIEITPTVLRPKANMSLEITLPSGEVVEKSLIFDSQRYYHTLKTDEIGKYAIKITYSYDNKEFVAITYLGIGYSREYDSFTIYDPSSIHEFIRGKGEVITEGYFEIVPRGEIETYEKSCVALFMIIAVCLFVVDVFVRKLKWNDIKSLFKKSQAKGGAK